MEISRDIMEQNVARLNGQMGSTLFEAGKQIGRLEGSRDTLLQIIKLMDDAGTNAVTPEATAKVAEGIAAKEAELQKA